MGTILLVFKKSLIAIALLTFSLTAFSQIPIENGTFQYCGGVIQDAELSGNYGDANYTMTICPDNPGDVVSLSFNVFDLYDGPGQSDDNLVIWDGDPTVVGNGDFFLGNYTGNSLTGLAATGTVNNTSGCLTLVFNPLDISANDNFAGFSATISCTTPCANPTVANEIQNPVPNINEGQQTLSVCLGDPITFADNGSFAEPGFTIENYIWNLGDGEVIEGGPTLTHTYDEPGEKIVFLTVADNNGCQSVNVIPMQILVSTIPLFQTDFEPITCVNSELVIDGNAIQSVTWTALPPQVVAGESYLSDDVGQTFDSPLEFAFFEPDATLDDCDDFLSATLNMEHSYIGDLDIFLECPNGTTVFIHEQAGGGIRLGEPVDTGGSDGVPGVGYDYSWSNNATNGTIDQNGVNTTYTNTQGNQETANVVPVGTYNPVGDFCDFVGCPLNGTWTIHVTDNIGADDGFIFEWGLNLNPELYPDVTTFTPEIGLNVDSTFWSGPFVGEESNGGNTITVIPDAIGSYDYTFTSINNFGCQQDTSITIIVQDPPIADAGMDLVFCEGQPVVLQGGLGGVAPAACGDDSGSFDYCYTNNDNLEWTFCPDTPGDGTFMQMSFSQGFIEAPFDDIWVYDGPDTSAPILGPYSAWGPASDDLTGVTFTATNAGGCLTFVFDSDGSVSCDGGNDPWMYSVGCTNAGGYNFAWEPAELLNDPNLPSPVVTGLTEETDFTLTLSPLDLPGCTATDVVNVGPSFDFDVASNDASCVGVDNGNIQLLLDQTSGNGPFTVTIADPNGNNLFNGPYASPINLANLEGGDYDVTVAETGGCVYEVDVEIVQPDFLDVEVSADSTICVGGMATIVATSTEPTANFVWDNGLPISSFQNITSDNPGTYTVQAVTPEGCSSDDATVTISVFDPLSGQVAGDFTVCTGAEVTNSLNNIAGGLAGTYDWYWTYNGVDVGSANSAITYETATSGALCAVLTDGCESPELQLCTQIAYEPVVEFNVTANPPFACAPDEVVYDDGVPDELGNAIWNLGEGDDIFANNPSYFYETPGSYNVTCQITTPTGCIYFESLPNFMQVYDKPAVGWNTDNQPTRIPETEIQFVNNSQFNAERFEWTFDTLNVLGQSLEENPVFSFPYDMPGTYPVKLHITDENGCTNEYTRDIIIDDMFNLFIPNSFTPNADGINDLFKIYGTDVDLNRFEINVYDRWGVQVYQSDNLYEGWRGNNQVTGEYYVQSGVYNYIVTAYSIATTERQVIKGEVMVVR